MSSNIRAFNLTPELCVAVDKLPNKSAWIREMLHAHLIDNNPPITTSMVRKLIEERLKEFNTLSNAPSTRGMTAMENQTPIFSVTNELDSLIGMSGATYTSKLTCKTP